MRDSQKTWIELNELISSSIASMVRPGDPVTEEDIGFIADRVCDDVVSHYVLERRRSGFPFHWPGRGEGD